MRWRAGLVAMVLVGACAGGALADAPLSHGLTRATVGGTVTVSAQLVDPGAYTLSLSDPTPAQGAICAAKVAGPSKASHGRISLTGKVPATLGCYDSSGTLLTRVKMTAGTYTLFLCQADGPTGCDGSNTVIQHRVVVKLPAAKSKSH
jgi:hypothetical protein